MGLLNNIKVFGKIMILVVIAAIGMAAIGYKGYSTIIQSKDGMAVIYNQSLQQVQEICRRLLKRRILQEQEICRTLLKRKRRTQRIRKRIRIRIRIRIRTRPEHRKAAI